MAEVIEEVNDVDQEIKKTAAVETILGTDGPIAYRRRESPVRERRRRRSSSSSPEVRSRRNKRDRDVEIKREPSDSN
ncbi:hypothetical protein M3Y96_00298700 [Aphelenchoides besseyi]|nr:hypothetical protein M3Y96_00298700 [Aphelenchoides besseyi]